MRTKQGLINELVASSLFFKGGTLLSRILKALPTIKYCTGKYKLGVEKLEPALKGDSLCYYSRGKDQQGSFIRIMTFNKRAMSEQQLKAYKQMIKVYKQIQNAEE